MLSVSGILAKTPLLEHWLPSIWDCNMCPKQKIQSAALAFILSNIRRIVCTFWCIPSNYTDLHILGQSLCENTVEIKKNCWIIGAILKISDKIFSRIPNLIRSSLTRYSTLNDLYRLSQRAIVTLLEVPLRRCLVPFCKSRRFFNSLFPGNV